MSPLDYHLAQYNVARLVAPLDDPLIADFVAALPVSNPGASSTTPSAGDASA